MLECNDPALGRQKSAVANEALLSKLFELGWNVVFTGFVSYSQSVWMSVDEARFEASLGSSFLPLFQDGTRPRKKTLALGRC